MENSKSIRVLQLNSGSKEFGGVSSFLYNLYTNIDTDIVQFDFISPNITTYEIHREHICQMGGHIYELGITGNIFERKVRLYRKLNEFLSEHHYDIVHINSGNFFFNLFALAALKKQKVKHRLVHSHNNGDTNRSVIKKIVFNSLKPCLDKWSTVKLACSVSAAEYMFTKKTVASGKVSIIRNGIDAQRFSFNECVRTEVRKELGVQNNLVIGHVGRFTDQKNHLFLLKIFEEIVKKENSAVLILVGEGILEDTIKVEVRRLHLERKVIFLGTRKDVERIYQAMDLFFLPSVYEGFGIVNIEAQTTGLKCIVSDVVPAEVDVTDNIVHLQLSDNADKWAAVAIESSRYKRKDCTEKIVQAGYDIKDIANNMQMFYEQLV